MTSNLLRSTLAAIALTFTAAPALAQTQPSIDGRWEGPVDLPNGTTITAVFRVAGNATTAVFDSPEQGAKGIEATVTRDGPKVTLTVPMAMLVYNATLSADGKTLSGGMSQGGGVLSVTMVQKAEGPRTFMTGPAVQDLWMLLSGRTEEMRVQLDDIVEGYQEFADFDHHETSLIEPLRTLRIMHYAGWLARRWDDPAFPRAFPWFKEPKYWEQHVLDLREQLGAMEEAF